MRVPLQGKASVARPAVNERTEMADVGRQARGDVRCVLLRVGQDELAILTLPTRLAIEDSSLSPAERDVVAAVVAGRSNAEIAAARGTSPRTVANQVALVFRKLGVGSRSELVARWLICGDSNDADSHDAGRR